MNNNELDEFLKQKLAPLQTTQSAARTQPSIAPQVMQRVAQLSTQSTQRHWVLAFAMLLGTLVCLPSLKALDVFANLQQQTKALGSWLTGQLGTWSLDGSMLPDPTTLVTLAALVILCPVMFLLLDE